MDKDTIDSIFVALLAVIALFVIFCIDRAYMHPARFGLKRAPRWARLPLDEKNRMLRAGLGLYEGRFFIRIDLWWAGFRWTPCPEK